jgi:hypothetical protein
MNNPNKSNYGISNIDICNDDLIEDLDTSWIQDFDKIDNEYKMYYTEELSFIKLHIIYVNISHEIEKIKEEKILLKNPGMVQKEELLGIIKNNTFLNKIKYSLLSILKFNINLEPNHLKTFLKNKNKSIGETFLQSIKYLDCIKFDKSITMFHDINDIFIIFHKKNKNTDLVNSDLKYTCIRTKKANIHSNSKNKTKKMT